MGSPARKSLLVLTLLSLLLAGLALAGGGCEGEPGEVKATVNAYYGAVVRGDREAQIAQWLTDRRAEATREADAWSKRDKDGFKVTEVHSDAGPAGDQRLVHVTISTNDKARPGKQRYESKTLLVQQVQGEWRIRDAR